MINENSKKHYVFKNEAELKIKKLEIGNNELKEKNKKRKEKNKQLILNTSYKEVLGDKMNRTMIKESLQKIQKKVSFNVPGTPDNSPKTPNR